MMKKKVLLIMPDCVRYSQYQWVPTSLLFLANMLKSKGYSPLIIDGRIESRQQTLKLIEQNINESLLIGLYVSCGTQLTKMLEIVQNIKTEKKDVPIVVGGAMPSAVPELLLSNRNIDYAIAGQGEYAICSLCEALEEDDTDMLDKIPNLWFRYDEAIRKSKSPFKRIEIDKMPPLCYDAQSIIDIGRYIDPDTRAINYNTSVGCVGQCGFCFWGKSYCYSHFSNDRVISDLKYLINKYDLKNITFDDPTFFVKRDLTMDLVRRIIDEGLNIKWRANGRVDILGKFSREDIDLIRKSGCHLIHIGMESGSERILKLMNKKITVEDGLSMMEKFVGNDIHMRLHFIIGVPTEELDDIRLTADFIKKVASIKKEFDYTVNVFNPYPGNKLTALAEKHGYVRPKVLEDYTEIEMLHFKQRCPSHNHPLPCIWDVDYELQWFSKEFNRKHRETFRKLIPRLDSIISVDGKEYVYSKIGQ